MDSILPSILTPDAMKAANEKLKAEMDKHPLNPGELPPFYAIAPGEEQPNVSVIVLKEIDDPENEDKKIRVYSRTIKREGLQELIKGLMGK